KKKFSLKYLCIMPSLSAREKLLKTYFTSPYKRMYISRTYCQDNILDSCCFRNRKKNCEIECEPIPFGAIGETCTKAILIWLYARIQMGPVADGRNIPKSAAFFSFPIHWENLH